MKENGPKPEQAPVDVERQNAREKALDDVFTSVYCVGRVMTHANSYNRHAINGAAARYLETAGINALPSDVTTWSVGNDDNEDIPSTVLGSVAGQVLFNAESELQDDERLSVFHRAQDSVYKTELMENRGDVQTFFDVVMQHAGVMLNAHAVNPEISKDEYKRLFNLYREVYIAQYMASENKKFPTPRLSFWAHTAEGGLIRLLGRTKQTAVKDPLEGKTAASAHDEEKDMDRWWLSAHSDSPRWDDPEDPDKPDGAAV